MNVEARGVPAKDLNDSELEAQGLRAHETRNWVFLHGTAEQYAHHTTRMLELEREYLRRHPKRTWQGSGGAAEDARQTAEHWRETLKGVIGQLEALIALPDVQPSPAPSAGHDPVRAFLQRLSDAPDGRMHRLEAHQAARECGLERAMLADLYKGDSPLVETEGQDRVLTEAGLRQI